MPSGSMSDWFGWSLLLIVISFVPVWATGVVAMAVRYGPAQAPREHMPDRECVRCETGPGTPGSGVEGGTASRMMATGSYVGLTCWLARAWKRPPSRDRGPTVRMGERLRP